MIETLATDETDRLIGSDKVEGTTVYDVEGNKLGSIKNFMVDKRTGRADYAVLEFGGLFGIGSDYYPLPWEMLDYDPSQGGYVVELDKDTLQSAPRYCNSIPVFDHAFGRQVYGFYGLAYPYF